MKRFFFHIILPLFLTFAVTNYVWADFFKSHESFIEIEKESEEKLRENEEFKPKSSFPSPDGGIHLSELRFPHVLTFFTQIHHNFLFAKKAKAKRYILFQQLVVYS